jgi:hypothetical protein
MAVWRAVRATVRRLPFLFLVATLVSNIISLRGGLQCALYARLYVLAFLFFISTLI